MVNFPNSGKNEDKLAILLSGGGMKVSWGVGVINALIQLYNLTNPDIVIPCSGSLLGSNFWVSGQHDSIRNAYTNDFYSTKEVVDLKRASKMMDIDYIVDVVLKELDPLDTEAIKNSDIDLRMPVIEKHTGNIRYFTNKDNVDILEVIRAGMSIPLISGINPWVPIDGDLYCDSALTATAQTHLEEAVNRGANKILIIDHDTDKEKEMYKHATIKERGMMGLYKFWNNFFGNGFDKGFKAAVERAENYKVPDHVEVYTLNPKELDIDLTDNSQESLLRSKGKGFDQVSTDQGLRRFLESSNPIPRPQVEQEPSVLVNRFGEPVYTHMNHHGNPVN
tara:strand:+ start:1577 stop:2581 length:1005 start_codon:yes stop_codon:yes gene_type:complete